MTDPTWHRELRDLEQRLMVFETRHQHELENILLKAVYVSQKEIFAKFGVNIDDALALQEFQQGLLFTRNVRRSINRGVGAMLLAVCGMIGTACSVWLWETVKRG